MQEKEKEFLQKENIALIGFMGVGKTTISHELTKQLGMKEVDTDELIVEREGMPVTQIFAEKGEDYFRKKETEVLHQLEQQKGVVISCGGGISMRKENVESLRRGGRIVLLTAKPQTILDRIGDSRDRPILNGHMNVEYIGELMEKRRPYYETASDIVVSTDGKSKEKISEEIVSKLMAKEEENQWKTNAKQIDGHTRLLALLGSPVGHSGSPAMYNYSFEKLGLNYCYLCFDIKKEETKEAIEAMKLLQVRGFNVTMPCKTKAVEYMDELSRAAKLIGAVNTVVNEDGKLIGYNTDGYGWVRNLRENGVEISGRKMTICGSGGAASAIQITAALEGMREIVIFAAKDSFYANAEATAEKIRRNVPSCKVSLHDLKEKELLYQQIAESDIFANATRVGMKPMEKESVIEDKDAFRPGLVVSDVVYNPRETRLLREAKEAGCTVLGGMGMLLWQGAEAFSLYTGEQMPVKEVEENFFQS